MVSPQPTYLISSRHFDPHAADTYSRLIRLLCAQRCHVAVWETLFEQMAQCHFPDLQFVSQHMAGVPTNGVQAVLSVGGDGTFLAAAKLVMGTDVPVLGINRGRLGFLSDVAPDQLQQAVADLCMGNYRTTDFPVLNMYANDQREPIGFAVNEFAISKCDNSSMLTIDAYVDGDFLTTYWADGLILSTATGSTAYSLSVGGPIVYPTANCLTLAPVAPHILAMRPLVLPQSVVLSLRVDGRGPNIMTSFDGQTHLMPNGTRLRIAKANIRVRRIQLASYSFFRTLREKLLWGADARNNLLHQDAHVNPSAPTFEDNDD